MSSAVAAKRRAFGKTAPGYNNRNLLKESDSVSNTVLWIIAAILVIIGIVQLIQGQIILGIVLIVVGCLVGPGGYSVFKNRR